MGLGLLLAAGCTAAVPNATGAGGRGSAGGRGGAPGGAAGQGSGGRAGDSGGASGGTVQPGNGGAVGSGGAEGGRGGSTTSGGSGGNVVVDGGGSGGDAPVDAGAADLAGSDVRPSSDTGPGNFGGGPVMTSTVHLDIGVHDPSMIWDGQRYYMVATGSSSAIRASTNMRQWTNVGRFLTGVPAWIPAAIGQAPDGNTPWAPDITHFNGKFHVYYCASVFGKNTSVIGVATNVSLDPAAPGYGWSDQGLVIQTVASSDFNAIDPHVAFDAAGGPWLSFGSFWSGIKLRKLDPLTGKLATDDVTTYSIAGRNGGAIEAPSIILRDGNFYLFVSFDLCCRDASSTYRTMVGRSRTITGPYLDKAGVSMAAGGGDQVAATAGRYIGPGGGTAWKNGDVYLYAHHYYDGQGGGSPKLSVRPINFTADGWVTLGEPLFP